MTAYLSPPASFFGIDPRDTIVLVSLLVAGGLKRRVVLCKSSNWISKLNTITSYLFKARSPGINRGASALDATDCNFPSLTEENLTSTRSCNSGWAHQRRSPCAYHQTYEGLNTGRGKPLRVTQLQNQTRNALFCTNWISTFQQNR